MTNAEAIHLINQVRDVITKNPSWTKEATRVVNEAADMAVKSLKARWPCDKCKYNSPSSMGRKPCSCCPAEPPREEVKHDER